MLWRKIIRDKNLEASGSREYILKFVSTFRKVHIENTTFEQCLERGEKVSIKKNNNNKKCHCILAGKKSKYKNPKVGCVSNLLPSMGIRCTVSR